MKLELKYLAGYLPYDLNTRYLLSNVVNIDQFMDELRYKKLTAANCDFVLQFCKPILRPLSDLTKKIEVNGEKFVPIIKLNLDYDWSDNISIYDFSTITGLNMEDIYFVTDSLLEWHFDIYGLIDAGLAIDINTLN